MANKTTWAPVVYGDEYAERGDTHHFETGRSMYYYNPELGAVRRFALNDGAGVYAEAPTRGLPKDYPLGTLGTKLSSLFSAAKRRGSLKNVETFDY